MSVLGDDSFDYHDSEEEEEEDEDDELMARALEAAGKRNIAPPKPFQLENDEPIALDDSEDENPLEESKYQSDSEQSSEFSVDNHVIGDSGESEEENEEEAVLEQKPTKPHHLSLARKIVKKSIRTLTRKRAETKKAKLESHSLTKVKEAVPEPAPVSISLPPPKPEAKEEPRTVEVEVKPISSDEKNNQSVVDLMDFSDCGVVAQEEALPLESPIKEDPPIIEKQSEVVEATKQNDTAAKSQLQNSHEKKAPTPQVEKADKIVNSTPVDVKEAATNSNESSRHESSLLTEISNCGIDEIFNRYVQKNSDQSPTLDEFSEELFYCLQQNKQEIEKAQQLWNEKLHVKYKIRELMETIRRHRAVMEIEGFGYKPSNATNNSHPVISSKSSTTTNSEADHYEKHHRMSSESVSRLIQDVRASMQKRDEKQRTDELAGVNAGDGGFDSNSQWQAAGAQGRQGQIIDVQSIINDFRQKNPQEIPRRGRRMKSSFSSGYYENQQSQLEETIRCARNDFMSNSNNNSHDFSNSNQLKTNSGYPEVSLHPVQNLYKNLPGGPSGGAHFSGQKSSLLQSILTKVRA